MDPLISAGCTERSFQLWLHPFHRAVSPAPISTSALGDGEAMESRFAVLSEKAQAGLSALDWSTLGAASIELAIDRRGLCGCDCRGKVLVAMPMMSALISTHWDVRPSSSDGGAVGVIAYASGSSAFGMPASSTTGDNDDCGVWLIVVTRRRMGAACMEIKTSSEILGDAMAALGRLGAISDRFHGVDFSSASWVSSAIGNGASGAVALVRRRRNFSMRKHLTASSASSSEDEVGHSDSAEYAVKTWNSQSTRTAVIAEVSALVKAQGHPNVACMQGVFHSMTWNGEKEWLMVMQNHPGGDLTKLVGERGFPEIEALRITEHVLQGLVHIHSVGIIHRDVKLQNVVIAADGRAVLIDFGIAVHVSDMDQLKKKCGTPGYIAPEILLGLGCTIKSDVFSCGVLMYGILTGVLPFLRASDVATLTANVKAQPDLSHDEFANVSEDTQALVVNMLKRRTSSRLSARDALRRLCQHATCFKTALPGCNQIEDDTDEFIRGFQVSDGEMCAGSLSAMSGDDLLNPAKTLAMGVSDGQMQNSWECDGALHPSKLQAEENADARFDQSKEFTSSSDIPHVLDCDIMSEETRSSTLESKSSQTRGMSFSICAAAQRAKKALPKNPLRNSTNAVRTSHADVGNCKSMWSRFRRSGECKAKQEVGTFGILPTNLGA
eukprot:TRINITY_DN6078_c0_g2_i1.p1 TRINITY_DN6078_c0_g2~~TRINITY_DN6078_c0_g2_i1.p1  ORF type:complete len:666 (+),score=107.97 TRINITY_DN6078_c0_g2_i1:83-2080(+)